MIVKYPHYSQTRRGFLVCVTRPSVPFCSYMWAPVAAFPAAYRSQKDYDVIQVRGTNLVTHDAWLFLLQHVSLFQAKFIYIWSRARTF